MSNLLSLTTTELRRAADLKEKIAKLSKELGSILGESAPVAGKVTRRKRRKMSAATRAKMSAAQAARWANIKSPKSSVKKAK